jgi:hypothetical protein
MKIDPKIMTTTMQIQLTILMTAILVLPLLGCQKPSPKQAAVETDMRKETDEMVKRQMQQMGKPAPGGVAPGAPGVGR